MQSQFMNELEKQFNRQVPPLIQGDQPAEFISDTQAWMSRGHKLRCIAVAFAIRHVMSYFGLKARVTIRYLTGIKPTRIGG